MRRGGNIAHAGRSAFPIVGAMVIAALMASCRSVPVVPTPTAITLPPTPTAITFPPTPTAITLPPTPTPVFVPPTPTPIGGIGLPPLTTPEIVDILRPSVVQIAVLKSGRTGVATGIVYDTNGHVLTNWHVIDGASSIQVSFADGAVIPGSLFREDPLLDLAVIKVSRTGLRPAIFGDSSRLRVGEDVIAIGHALGLPGGPTVSKGVVSALNRTILGAGGDELTGLIQTDAAINEGNSGGPLVDTHAQVIGINTARITGGDGIGFALNINVATEAAARLLSLGPPPPSGYLGAFGSDITPGLAVLLGLPVSAGFGVEQVEPRSPAAGAGIKVDDIIVGMDDTLIRSGADLSEFLRTHRPGTKVRVRVIRGDFFSGFGLIAFDLTLGERESQ
jgi:S1-C subfamily serine protease